MTSVAEELILVPMTRAGAEALSAAAGVGLEGLEPGANWGVDREAGFEAQATLVKALNSEPEAEIALVRKGIQALEALFSHDEDLILIDEADGVGILAGSDYANLYDLLAFLREGDVDLPTKATVEYRGAQATVEIDSDPSPEFAETHLRVRLFCSPPPRGSDSEVYSGPILVRDAELTRQTRQRREDR